MSKNKKLSLSVAAALKKMAHRSFLVFLLLLFFSAAIAALIAFNHGNLSAPEDSSVASNSGVFGVSRAKEYREIFLIIEQRREDSNNPAPADYSRIFKELTKEKK